MVEQEVPLPAAKMYTFRSHGWVVVFDGEQWWATNERRQKVIGASDVLNAISVTAEWRRTHPNA